MFEKLRRKEKDPRIRLVLQMDGPLIQNADAKAADLRITLTSMLGAAIGWYDTPLGDTYRNLDMQELPELPARPESTNWPSQGTTAHFLLEPEVYSGLERHMMAEQLTPEDCSRKILTCYLTGIENIINIDTGRESVHRDQFGFTHPRPPRPDPRDE